MTQISDKKIIFSIINMDSYKELSKQYKNLGLTRTQKKKLGLKGRLNKEQLKQFLENYKPPIEPTYRDLIKKAKELGYNLKMGKSKEVLIKWIKDREKKNKRNKRLREKREQERNKTIGVSLDVDFFNLERERIEYRKRDVKFNSTPKTLWRDINTLMLRVIKEQLGGDEDYWYAKYVAHRVTESFHVYNVTDVPLKRSKAPCIEFFNSKGELIVDNKFFQNDNCVPEFLYEFIQSNNNKKGTKKLPNFSIEQIETEIENLWEREENSFSCYNSTQQRLARGDKLLAHQKLNERYNARKHGVSVCQLEIFCKQHNISLRCLDSSFRLFHTYISDQEKRIKNTIMIIVEDGHIYPIVDKELRKSIQSWGNKKPSDCIFSKEIVSKIDEMKYEKFDYDNVLNIPELKKDTIYITSKRDLLKDIFLKRWIDENKRYNFKARGQSIIQLNLENNIKMLYNKDLDLVDELCKDLKIPFVNQTLSAITNFIYPEYDTTTLTSYLNTKVKLFFEKYMSLSPWVKQYTNINKDDDIITYDKNKFYASICKEKSNYIQFDIFDDVMPYSNEEIEDDTLYLVETNQNIMFQGTGVYIPEIIRIGLSDNLIKQSDIKMMIRGSRTNETNQLKMMVENFYSKLNVKLAKTMVNRNIGILGSKHQEIGKIKFTNDINVASTNFYNGVTTDFKIVEKICEKPELYLIDDTTNVFKMNSTFVTNFQIIQQGIYKMYLLYKQIGGEIVKVQTDSITIKNPQNVIETSTEMGGVKIEVKKIKKKTTLDPFYKHKVIDYNILKLNELTPIKIDDEWNINYDMLLGKSFLLQARAGRGKTYIINNLKKIYEDRGMFVKTCAYTHCAKKLIGGVTLHKLFGRKADDSKIVSKDFKRVDVVIVDEISMVPSEFYRELINLKQRFPRITIILAGDFDQLKPIHEEFIEFRNSNMISDIVDYSLELKINKRCDNIELDNIVTDIISTKRRGYTSSLKLQVFTEGNCFINICKSNAKRSAINKKYMDILSNDVDHIVLEIPDEEHDRYSQDMKIYNGLKLRCRKNFIKEEIYNGEFFTVKAFTEKQAVIVGEDEREHSFNLNKEFLHNFNPNYAMTVHSTQGQTFNEPYIIHEKFKLDWRSLNVALTRTTNIKNIYFE